MSMQDSYDSFHFTDVAGRPAGGQTFGRGFTIAWQSGPLGRGPERIDPNGAFVETIIAAAADRIRFYNESGFYCIENEVAIDALEDALYWLNRRTARREAEGVEGTHEGS